MIFAAVYVFLIVHVIKVSSENCNGQTFFNLAKSIYDVSVSQLDSLENFEQQSLLRQAQSLITKAIACGVSVPQTTHLSNNIAESLQQALCVGSVCDELLESEQIDEQNTEIRDSSLPHGWSRIWNEESQRDYFYCATTQETTWDRPTEACAALERMADRFVAPKYRNSSRYVSHAEPSAAQLRATVEPLFGAACDPRKVAVAISDEEREADELTPDTFGRIVDALRECGVAKVSGVFDKEFVAELAAAEATQWQRFLDFANGSIPTPQMFDERMVELRSFAWLPGNKRVELKMPFVGPFREKKLWKNLLFQPMMASMQAREEDLEIDEFNIISSLEQSPAMHWHRDTHPVFNPSGVVMNESPRFATLPYSYVAIVPLLDMTPELGPTQFLTRSHVPCLDSEKDDPKVPLSSDDNYKIGTHKECRFASTVVDTLGEAGTATLMDLRILHRGTPNSGKQRRPIIYVSYSNDWFRLSTNFPHHTPSSFESAFDPALHTLMDRVVAERHVFEAVTKIYKNAPSDEK